MIRRHVVDDNGAHVKAIVVCFSAGTRISKAVAVRPFKPQSRKKRKKRIQRKERIKMIRNNRNDRNDIRNTREKGERGLHTLWDYHKG